ncbi:hypothetical protein [Escherichia albertii]|uniref:hypothetical protein n=1 Tax=Escherichia albertii TaxID=208962 RepID=UPI001386A3D4|nr:hypothetical protein [Escherichia albertii]
MSVILSINQVVIEIAKLDPTAQEFRYPVRTDNAQTIPDRIIVNYLNLQTIITELASQLKHLLNESECYVKECRTGTLTKELSREQLLELSKFLPNRDTWREKIAIFQ